ncbi:MAG: zinc ribbon domain-containing protein [Ruminococcaceae bacterium]|nr:zinc ribbon domain-containing protein [Oscillospiraceae bacterium]
MKICPNCNANLSDETIFCTVCGTAVNSVKPVQPQQAPPQASQPTPQAYTAPAQPSYAPAVDPYDHTADFDQKDISDNKVIAMLVYLLGVVGVLIALIGSQSSAYVAFHVRQALKFLVVETLVGIITVFLCWTFIVPIAASIFLVVLLVIKIICFFDICSGKAKEPAIIREFKFLR